MNNDNSGKEQKIKIDLGTIDIFDVYTRTKAVEIYNKFQEKGWNFYKKLYNDPKENIKNCLVDFLQYNGNYVLLPHAENPRDYDSVMSAMENLAIRLDRKMPTITINEEKHHILGLTLNYGSVKIHSEDGMEISYTKFISSLDSIVQTKDTE